MKVGSWEILVGVFDDLRGFFAVKRILVLDSI